jgi:hypothetical protein
VPYDTPSNKGILILKMPDTAQLIRKVVAKSYSNTGGASQIEVFHSNDDGISYISHGAITFVAVSETKELNVSISVVMNKMLLLSGDGKFKTISIDEYTENLIPIMTSANSPIGLVEASGGTNPWKAFDGNQSTYWEFTSSKIGNLSYQFSEDREIAFYSVYPFSASWYTMCPKSWTFDVYDGRTWINLDTQNNVTNWTMDGLVFKCKKVISGKKYRMNITDNNGSTSLAIGEFKMMTVKSLSLNVFDSQNFEEHGIDSITHFGSVFTKVINHRRNSQVVGTGKTYEHTIDMSKRQINKITLG